jgi:hypothetical protein
MTCRLLFLCPLIFDGSDVPPRVGLRLRHQFSTVAARPIKI